MDRPDRPPSATARAPQGIQSMETGLRVLTGLARAGRPLALREVAQATGLSASLAHRYLASLVRSGFAVPAESPGHYTLGPEALSVGLAALSGLDAVELAGRRLRELARSTGQTGMLSVWGPAGPTCVRLFRGEALLGTDVGLGSVFPLIASATGQVFLAWLTPSLTRRAVADELRRIRAEGHGTPVPVPQTLRTRIRSDGFAEAAGHFVSDIAAIAVPVFDAQEELAAVLCLVVRRAQLDRHRDAWLRGLREAARIVEVGGRAGDQGPSSARPADA